MELAHINPALDKSLADCGVAFLTANDGFDFGEMARCRMVCCRRPHESGFLARAYCLRFEASAPECAAAWRLKWVGQVPFQDDALAAAAARIWMGNGRQERLRVRVRRSVEYLLALTDLDDLSQIHHRDMVRDMANDGKVMRNEQIGESQFLLQLLQKIDDLGLDRDV